LIRRWLDAGEDDAAIERTLYLSYASTATQSPEPQPEPEPAPSFTLSVPQPILTHMLSPVPEQGHFLIGSMFWQIFLCLFCLRSGFLKGFGYVKKWNFRTFI